MRESKTTFGRGSWLLVILVAMGAILVLIRLVRGLGAVTNLNDAYPWGLWIGFDVLCGVALAAGGFTMAAIVYLFRLERFHPIVRPAVLTGFLGYLLVVAALLVDLGRYYKIWHPMIFWQPDSVMFEVGWCVAIYTVVLGLEFVPAVFERYEMDAAQRRLRSITPFAIIVLLGIFAQALTHSWGWTALVLALLTLFQILVWSGVFPDDSRVAPLLVIAGVILSTLHQSSLGSLFLIVPHKLHALWHTPVLPLLFFLSAVAGGLAMVIFEALVSARVFNRGLEMHLLSSLGKALPYVLAAYLLLKVADLVGRNAVEAAFVLNLPSVCLWLEIGVGAVLPLSLLIMPEVCRSAGGLFWSSLCVIIGLVLNRLNVSLIGVEVMTWEESYFPSWMEFAVSIAAVAAGLLAFSLIVRNFPIYEESRPVSSPGT